MSSSPVVSVVVPFLDTPPEFFREALESVRAQSFADWELILVDDGSGPEAKSVANAACRASERVRVVTSGPQRPVGISGARNAGLLHARGEFLSLLDSDDVWHPEHLERHVAALRAMPRAAMVITNALYWTSWRESGSRSDFVPGESAPGGLLEPPALAIRVILGEMPVPCPASVTVRRAVLDAVGGHEPAWATDRRVNSMYEDQVFYVKLGSRYPVLRLPVVLERYRLHGDSVTGSASEDLERESRRQFLDWCASTCAPDLPSREAAELLRAVRRARWRLDHPVLAGWLRRGAKLMRRMGSPV